MKVMYMTESNEKNILSENIKKLADSLGIDMLGFAGVSEFQNYMLSSSQRRDPKLSLSDAKTLIVAGIYIGGFVLPSWDNPDIGRTSRLYLSGFFMMSSSRLSQSPLYYEKQATLL